MRVALEDHDYNAKTISMRMISVVTISFNQGGFLPVALTSVGRQRGTAIEHICVDPGSKDDSRKLIQQAADRSVHVIPVFEPDQGPADGLNNGFARARGDVYYFLNADDAVCEGAFEFVRAFFDSHPDVDVIYGGGFLIDEVGRPYHFIRPTHFTCLAYLLEATNLLQQSFFFRRGAFERVGGFNPDNRVSWDGELFFRMKAAGLRFHAVYAPLGLFRVYRGSITTSDGQAQRRRAIRQGLAAEYFGRKQPGWFERLRPIWMLKKQLSAVAIYIRTVIFKQRALRAAGIQLPPLRSVLNGWCPPEGKSNGPASS